MLVQGGIWIRAGIVQYDTIRAGQGPRVLALRHGATPTVAPHQQSINSKQ